MFPYTFTNPKSSITTIQMFDTNCNLKTSMPKCVIAFLCINPNLCIKI